MDIEVNYKNKKRYKTAKYPLRQHKFWTWLIWILSKIMLRGKKFTLETIDMDGLKPPYILLSNHMSFVDLYAYADLFPGFIWQIPVSKNIYRIGLFSNFNYKKQNEILDDFLKNDFNYDDFEVIEKYKGKIPIYNKDIKLFKNRALIIGDAASQVKPTTGGGLLIGFETVEMAKKAILFALNLESFNSLNIDKADENDKEILQDCLKSYQEDFEERFIKEFSYQFKVQKTLCTLSDDDLDYFFEKLKEKEADKLISEYGDMDNQSILVKEFLKRGLVLTLLPAIHKRELAKIWLL